MLRDQIQARFKWAFKDLSTLYPVLRTVAYYRRFFNYVQEDGFTYYKFSDFQFG